MAIENTECMEQGIIQHPIDERFSLEEIIKAHKKSESGETIGKNVIEIA